MSTNNSIFEGKTKITTNIQFLEGFEKEIIDPEVLASVGNGNPVPPASTKFTVDAIENYTAYKASPGMWNAYGLTGLMTMTIWPKIDWCYSAVASGLFFLFPGTYFSNENYTANCSISCQSSVPAMGPNNPNPLHLQMCDLLDKPTTYFIGFALKLDSNGNKLIGYNSGICNVYWFGDRQIPANFNGVNWQQIISGTLDGLP